MQCHICGEEKEKRQFHRIRFFYTDVNTKKNWCRDCMKMYIDMKKEESRKEEIKHKVWIFVLKFD